MSNFLKIKKNINSVVKYEAGISKLADRKKIIKLSSNESAFGVSPKIKKILKEFENKIFRYPDPENNKLKEIIFKKYKLDEIVKAHTDLENRKITGPAVIIP